MLDSLEVRRWIAYVVEQLRDAELADVAAVIRNGADVVRSLREPSTSA